jgi:hypothetical protein
MLPAEKSKFDEILNSVGTELSTVNSEVTSV